MVQVPNGWYKVIINFNYINFSAPLPNNRHHVPH